MELADRVRQRRIELGLSQEELAEKMGYSSRSSINKIEMGRPISQKIIMRLADALDTTPAYLMGWDQEMNSDFGQKMKELRELKKVTIMEMADEIHIDVDTLVEYENGTRKVPLEILKKIADYFAVDINDLVHIRLNEKTHSTLISTDPKRVERYNRFITEVNIKDFTDEEFEQLLNYAKFLESQRKGND